MVGRHDYCYCRQRLGLAFAVLPLIHLLEQLPDLALGAEPTALSHLNRPTRFRFLVAATFCILMKAPLSVVQPQAKQSNALSFADS
jgi:hypothetical protein